jgi:hypothetical protein
VNIASHQDDISVHSVDSFMRQNFRGSETSFVGDLHVLSRTHEISNTDPAAHGIFPSDDASLNECIWLDHGAPEDGRVRYLDTCSNLAVCTDYHVWTQLGSRVNLRRWMYDHRCSFHSLRQ